MESALAVAFPPLHPLYRGTTDPGITLSAATYRRRRDRVDRSTRPQSSLLSMRPIESHLGSVWHLRIAVTLGPITDGRVVRSFRPRRFFWRPSEVPRALSMRCSNSSHNLRTRKKEKEIIITDHYAVSSTANHGRHSVQGLLRELPPGRYLPVN